MASALEQRIARMKEKGIPMPITQMGGMTEGASTAPVTVANQDMHSRLASLKSGANRQGMNDLVASKSKQQGFQGIPETTQRKNPNNPANKVSPGMSVPVKGIQAPPSGEFSAMEAMYGGANTMDSYGAPQQPALNPQSHVNPNMKNSQPELSVPNKVAGPVFDPVAMLNQRAAQPPVQQEQGYNYLQHAVNPQQGQAQNTQQQQQFNFEWFAAVNLLEEIAEQTMTKILSEFTEKGKKKLTYENIKVKGEDKVIKTQDGKYYIIKPVKLKS